MTGNDRRGPREIPPNEVEMSKSASTSERRDAPHGASNAHETHDYADGEYRSRRSAHRRHAESAGSYRQNDDAYDNVRYADDDSYSRTQHAPNDAYAHTSYIGGADNPARDRYSRGMSDDARQQRADVPDWVVSAAQAFRQRPSAPPPAEYMPTDISEADARSGGYAPPREPVRAAISVAESPSGNASSGAGNSAAHTSDNAAGAEHEAPRTSSRRAAASSAHAAQADAPAQAACDAAQTGTSADAKPGWSERRRERRRQRTERKSMKRALRRPPAGRIPAGRESADVDHASIGQSGNVRAAPTVSIRAAESPASAADAHAPDAARAVQSASPQPPGIRASSAPSSSDGQTQPEPSRRQHRKERKRQRRADRRARRAARKGKSNNSNQSAGETSSAAKPRKRRRFMRLMMLAALLAAMIMLALNEPALMYTPLGPLASASSSALSLVVDGCYHVQHAMSNMFTRDYDYDDDYEPARESNFPLTLLVNYWNPLPDDLSPALVSIGDGRQVDARCADDLDAMLDACRRAGHDPVICSAYRSHSYQTGLYENKVERLRSEGMSEDEARKEAMTVVAYPGTSEHQTGLALDIVDAGYQELDTEQENTDVQKWLMKNSYRYGFILRYPTGKSRITGIIYEPWHYRYVGREVAREVYESGLCFEEYLEQR